MLERIFIEPIFAYDNLNRVTDISILDLHSKEHFMISISQADIKLQSFLEEKNIHLTEYASIFCFMCHISLLELIFPFTHFNPLTLTINNTNELELVEENETGTETLGTLQSFSEL